MSKLNINRALFFALGTFFGGMILRWVGGLGLGRR